jgi:hypothetical protein
MIIWLASYPKSGNTWLRSIIASLLYSDNGIFTFEQLKKIEQFPEKKFFKDIINDFNNFNEIKENWILAQEKINLKNKIKLFKTHQGKYTVGNHNFTNKENTLATIYVVRDPRSLVKSISNHFSLSVDKACEFLLSPEVIGNGKNFEEQQDGMYNLLGKWNDHYRSWTRDKNNLLVIKYEDLIANAGIELIKIVEFLNNYLNFKTDKNKNNKILETTSFGNLSKMEDQGLFKENVLNKKNKDNLKFFHLGPKNIWQDNLDKEIVSKLEKNFYTEMKELNYL